MTTVTGLSSCLPDLVVVYTQAAASFGKNLYLTLKENAHGTLMQLVRKHSQFGYQDSNGLRMVSINKNSVPPKKKHMYSPSGQRKSQEHFKRFVSHKQEESDKHKGLVSRSISRRLPRPPIHQHLPLISTPETFCRM